jgi:radical SAM protein with 4Fe4S-binding SPASM domain
MVHWGRPMSLSIEPTTACNLRCPECPSGLRSFSRATGNLKSDFFRKTIDAVHKDLISLTFYFQGEPYINPSFLEMVGYARDKGIYTITSTNGHFLSEENCLKTIQSGLDRLIISIDGTTQEVYEQYRKEGNLSKVIEGSRRLIEMRNKMNAKSPYVIFQFLVVRPNEHQIDEVQQLARDIGVDEVKYKTAQLYDYENGNDLMPTNLKYSRYVPNGQNQYRLRDRVTNECWKLWHSAVITWDGKMVPCCFDKDATHVFGDLQSSSFSEVWQSNAAKAFRLQLTKGRNQIDICTNCSEGCKVWT